MSKLKTILIAVVSAALAAVIAIGGTVAYFTDTDSDINVMTVGNIKIEQSEWERDENGNFVPYQQGKPAIPAVIYDANGVPTLSQSAYAYADEPVYLNGVGQKVFDDNMKNVVDKFVTVKNTGWNDLYFRTVVAIEVGTLNFDSMVHVNYNNSAYALSAVLDANGKTQLVEIDGSNYALLVFTHKAVLETGKASGPSLAQLFINPKATQEDVAPLGNSWEILAFTQAVQAQGFNNAAEALTAAFGTITATNHPWLDASIVVPSYATNANQLSDMMADGANIVIPGTINGTTTVLPFGESYPQYTAEYYMAAGGSITGGELILDEGNEFGLMIASDPSVSTTLKNLTVTGNSEALIYVNLNGAPVNLSNVTVNANGGAGVYAEFTTKGLVLNNVTVKQSGIAAGNQAWFETAVAAARGSSIVINDGTYESSKYAVYCFGSQYEGKNSVVTINGGTFKGELRVDGNDKIVINAGTFTVDPSAVNGVDINGKVTDNGDGTWTVAPYEVSNETEIRDQLTAGNSVTLTDDIEIDNNLLLQGGVVDGNGNTLDADNTPSSYDCAISTTGGTVQNLTVTGDKWSTRAIGAGSSGTYKITENLYIKNVTIDNVLYAINGSGNADCRVIVSDSTICGWLSFSGVGGYDFYNCKLATGNSYLGYIVIYGDTSFTNCEFSEFWMCADNSCPDGSNVVFTNCTYDGVKVTADNFKTLFMAEDDEVDFGKLINKCNIIIDGVAVAK